MPRSASYRPGEGHPIAHLRDGDPDHGPDSIDGDPVPGALSRRLDALWRLDEEARIRRGRVRDAVEPEDRPAETSRREDTLLAVGTLVVVIVCLVAIGLFSIG